MKQKKVVISFGSIASNESADAYPKLQDMDAQIVMLNNDILYWILT